MLELTFKEQQALWKSVDYYRQHLDVFIIEYAKVKLKPFQAALARAVGNCSEIALVQSRGLGKTWFTAVVSWAICVLYPGSLIAVVSATADQATLVLQKIETYFLSYPDIRREIKPTGSGTYVSLKADKGKCVFYNGSQIESFSLSTAVGRRAKMVIVDEAAKSKIEEIDTLAAPLRNFRRQVAQDYGFKDYASKMLYITSACLKSNPFFGKFEGIMQSQANGDPKYFASALNYESAIINDISDEEFFDGERKRMTKSAFDMEYGAIFLGEEEDSVFPFNLTETCRTLTTVEIRQPRGAACDYTIALDIATSKAKTADNSVITVLKQQHKKDGSISAQLVYIRSYHGKKLDYLANEIRKLMVRFPNTVKVIYDANGLGDSMSEFLGVTWTDPETGTEYPPLVSEEDRAYLSSALPLLYPFKANNALNNQLASGLRVALENRTIELPVTSDSIYKNRIVLDEDGTTGRELSMEEQAIFIETDALQVEMGNIVERVSGQNNFIYDTARAGQHKDRYSSLAMNLWYCGQMEKTNKIRMNRPTSEACVGIFVPI